MPRIALAAALLLSAVFMMRSPRSPDSFAAWERARVRAHLDSPERELRGAPVTGLTAAQRAARVRALDRLHDYRVPGVFPQNTDFPDERVPYFIDRYGTRCAMAYLIEQSGQGEFVGPPRCHAQQRTHPRAQERPSAARLAGGEWDGACGGGADSAGILLGPPLH